MSNADLNKAKWQKKDEFYTQYADIEKEIMAYFDYNPHVFKGKTILLPCDEWERSNFTKFFVQNFETFGLKKLISTSYAYECQNVNISYQFSMFEGSNSSLNVSNSRGKIFILEDNLNQNRKVDKKYLRGNGDFRSEEIKKLRDEADIIITNPPFSLFREFLSWLVEAEKKFIILGNLNAITYKEMFSLIKNNEVWLGVSIHSGDREFEVPEGYSVNASVYRTDKNGRKFIRVKGVRWFTNIEHGQRCQPLRLMTMADNLKHSRHKEIREQGYKRYDNYNAIEVPFTDAIPSDYEGVMGVPISFLDKYCIKQFAIVGCSSNFGRPIFWDKTTNMSATVNGEKIYKRLFIKKRRCINLQITYSNFKK